MYFDRKTIQSLQNLYKTLQKPLQYRTSLAKTLHFNSKYHFNLSVH